MQPHQPPTHQPRSPQKAGAGRDGVESSCLQQRLSAMLCTPRHRIRRSPSREPSPALKPRRRRVVPEAGSHDDNRKGRELSNTVVVKPVVTSKESHEPRDEAEFVTVSTRALFVFLARCFVLILPPARAILLGKEDDICLQMYHSFASACLLRERLCM